jgi:AraC family transcriptional regulator
MNLSSEEVDIHASGMHVEVKTIRSLNVAFVETHLGDEDAIPNAFKRLTRWADPRGFITLETRFIGWFLDMPFFTEYSKCRFRACISLPENAGSLKDAGTTVIPAGRYATYSMKGTLQSEFSHLVAFRHGWLDESGYQIAEITGFEFYSENPAHKPYESIEREVFIPVRPA